MASSRKIPGLILFLGCAYALAQPAAPPSRPVLDQAAKLSQYYENLATRTLARYYEEATFLVKAKVDIEPPP